MRKSAVEKCLKEIDLGLPPELFVDGDHTIEAGIKALSSLTALRDRPSAVLCSNDMTAIGVMRAAFDLSLNIPRDLSVIGFDDIRLAQFMTPPLTTVQMSQTEIPACHSQHCSILWNHPAVEVYGRYIRLRRTLCFDIRRRSHPVA